MGSTTARLSEPTVLAHAKQRLFPDDDGYAVVDTQFSSDRWLASRAIDAEVKESLSPFNHVQVGSGYPDLVGARLLDEDLLEMGRVGDEPPLVVVEAKGDTEHGGADVEQGIVQAHDRLQEANVAYVAAPTATVSQSAGMLARELNVGLLGVSPDGSVDPLEIPRLVGNRTTTETTAIRFQASAQGVADRSFGLNHPKNYLAYPLALYHPGPTDRMLSENVVRAVSEAKNGATFLNLVDGRPDSIRLTPLGRDVVRFAHREYGSVDAALRKFDEWKRSRERFCDLAPRWGMLTRQVVSAYPATRFLVEEIQNMHDLGVRKPTLPQLVEHLHEHHPSFTVELFVRGRDDIRSRVLNADGELQMGPLSNGSTYYSPTVFQLKAILYHAGIVTERGAEPSNLDPTVDVWALREPI
ncbi:MAG: hypothetical protein ACOCSP_01245 [archaeon]